MQSPMDSPEDVRKRHVHSVVACPLPGGCDRHNRTEPVDSDSDRPNGVSHQRAVIRIC